MAGILKNIWNKLMGQTEEDEDAWDVMIPAEQPQAEEQPDWQDPDLPPEEPNGPDAQNYPPLVALDTGVSERALRDALHLLRYHDPEGRARMHRLADSGSRAARELMEIIDRAEDGDAYYQLLLGREYQYGILLPRNYRMAARCYLMALNQGDERGRSLLRELLVRHQNELSWILDESEVLRQLNDEVTAEKLAERKNRQQKEEEARRRREEQRSAEIARKAEAAQREREERQRAAEERAAEIVRKAEEARREREERAERQRAELDAQLEEACRTQTQQLEITKRLADLRQAHEDARLQRLAEEAERAKQQRRERAEEEVAQVNRQVEETQAEKQKREEALKKRQEYFRQMEEQRAQEAREKARQELATREERAALEAKKKVEGVLETVRTKDKKLAETQAEKEKRLAEERKCREELTAEAQKAMETGDVEKLELLAQIFRYGNGIIHPDWQMQAQLESRAKLCKKDPEALSRVGADFQFGTGGFKKDLEEAFEFYELAGDLFHMESVLRDWKALGDTANARDHVERYFNACKDPRQRAVICSNVEYGYWYPPDKEKAYQLCLMNGDTQQAEEVAYRISEMYRARMDAAGSYEWLLRSGSRKNTIQRRMVAVAALFETGTGGKPKDLLRAYTLYQNAERAEEAARVAMKISECYTYGEGGYPRSTEEAVKWRRRAGQRPYTLV